MRANLKNLNDAVLHIQQNQIFQIRVADSQDTRLEPEAHEILRLEPTVITGKQ